MLSFNNALLSLSLTPSPHHHPSSPKCPNHPVRPRQIRRVRHIRTRLATGFFSENLQRLMLGIPEHADDDIRPRRVVQARIVLTLPPVAPVASAMVARRRSSAQLSSRITQSGARVASVPMVTVSLSAAALGWARAPDAASVQMTAAPISQRIVIPPGFRQA